MAAFNIYTKNNVLRTVLYAADNSTHQTAIRDDSILTLSMTSQTCVRLEPGDYVNFLGLRFWLLEGCTPMQTSTVEWNYDVKFSGVEGITKQALMLNSEGVPLEAYHGPAREQLAMVVMNLNRWMNTTDWKVGDCVATENLDIDYSGGTYCNEALGKIAEAAGVEWWIEGTTVNISRAEHGEQIELCYGDGLLTIERDNADNVPFFTRMFPVGSSRNIEYGNYGHARLQLPGGVKYVERNADRYGVVERYEEEAFADIYPRRTGHVSSVRTEQAKNDDGTEFTIYYFKDGGLDFNPNDYSMEIDPQKHVIFQSGDVAGRDFEVNYDDVRQEFEIITQWPYDNDVQVPGGLLVPKQGDTYILYNIRMPQEYYPAAEEELAAAVEKYLNEHSEMTDRSVYKCRTNYIQLNERGITLYIGQRVRLVSEQFFPGTGYRDSRITRINRNVERPNEADIEISDVLSQTSQSSMQDSIAAVRHEFKTATKTFPDIIRSWEDTLPTDTNLFSARRSLREFLSKKHDDTTAGMLTMLGGARFGNNAAWIDTLGNAEFLTAVIRDILRSEVFTDGMTGEGFGLWTDEETGLASMTLDRLTVRQSLVAMELLIEKIRSVGGQIVVSAANGTVKSIDNVQLTIDNESADCYVLTFEEANEFVVGDLVRCQVFNGTEIKSYWAEVVSADGTSITVPVSEFGGALPAAGDELVLMGNTENPLRQNLISISATEDGQPRIDVLDGVKTKNFNGALRVRLGNLEGIYDSWFPLDNQPKGNGLYADNAYLRGNFVLINGEDVKTKFEIMDGKFNSVISSVLDDMSGADGNIFRNSSFYRNLWYWTSQNLVNFIDVSGSWLYVGSAFYTEKQNVADIIFDGSRNVLRLKGTSLLQVNGDFITSSPTSLHVGGGTSGTYVVSFFYRALSAGTLSVGFAGKKLYKEVSLSEMAAYQKMTVSAEWDGTGDFMIGFTGEILVYGLTLTADAVSDAIIRMETRISQTESQILLMASKSYVDSVTGQIYQYYDSQLSITATAISTVSSRISELEQASAGWITTADGNKLWASLQSYNTLNNTLTQQQSSITQLADSITSAVQSVTILDGTVSSHTSSIQQLANSITSVVQSVTTLDGVVSTHASGIRQLADSISSIVSEVDALTGAEIVSRINQTASSITIDASKIYFYGDITANGNVRINSDGTIIAKGGLAQPFETHDYSMMGGSSYSVNLSFTNRFNHLFKMSGDPQPNVTVVLPNDATCTGATSILMTGTVMKPLTITQASGASFGSDGRTSLTLGNVLLGQVNPTLLYLISIPSGSGCRWVLLHEEKL